MWYFKHGGYRSVFSDAGSWHRYRDLGIGLWRIYCGISTWEITNLKLYLEFDIYDNVVSRERLFCILLNSGFCWGSDSVKRKDAQRNVYINLIKSSRFEIEFHKSLPLIT